MLPAKMGDGVFGSSSGGVNPTGACLVGTSSVVAAVALMVAKRVANFGDLVGVNEVSLEICLTEVWFEIDGVKRVA